MLKTLPPTQLHFEHHLQEIDLQLKKVTFANQREAFFEHLILSLPLPEIILRLKQPPPEILQAAQHLMYSSLYILSLGIDAPTPHSWAIARIPKRDVDFYRVSNATRYSLANAPSDASCLSVEVAHHAERFPLTETEVRERIYSGLNKLNILKTPQLVKTEWLYNLKYAHLIYTHETRAALAVIANYLAEH